MPCLFRPRAFVRAASALALVVLMPAVAHAEAAKAEVPLWTPSPLSLPNVDFDTTRPGIEVLSLASACTIAAPDAEGLITVSNELKFKVWSADGTTAVITPTTSNKVKSGKFPDPRQARFQCKGANVTNYRASFPGADADNFSNGHGVPVGPGHFGDACAPHTFEAAFALCDELPVRTFGVVVAKVAGERFIILSQAINLEYHNNLSPDDINVSSYAMTGYSMDGVQLWSRNIAAATSDGYTYAGNVARIADYLDSDGSDEIRLISISDDTGNVRYLYINPKTGVNIRTATVTPPTL